MSLNFVCGRVHREGERVPNPGVLTPPTPKKAQPLAPWQAHGKGPWLRTRGLGEVFGEMPCAALADEILTPGEGQVRALLCIGGNPAVAWPDQQKTMRALADLELLVCVDVRVGATSRLADYVLPGKLCLERADVPILCDTWFEKPYTPLRHPRWSRRPKARTQSKNGSFTGNWRGGWNRRFAWRAASCPWHSARKRKMCWS